MVLGVSRVGVVPKALLLVVLYALYVSFADYVHVYVSATVATIVLFYVGISVAVSLVRYFVLRSYLLRNGFAKDHVDNFTTVLRRLSTATVHVVFVFVLFSVLGIQVRELLTSISLFAVALTLIFKEYITNFISGAAVLFSNRYRVNDYVKVGEYKGRIRDVSFQSVELVTESGEVVYIPNTVLVTKEVANLSKLKEKVIVEEHAIELPDPKEFLAFEEQLQASISKEFSGAVENISLSLVKAEKDVAAVKISVRIKKYRYELEQAIRKHVASEVLAYRRKHASKKKK
jgi:small-conductance mechanosensitive channel